MAQWQCILCFAVVAASVAASLGAIIIRKNRRLPPRTDGTSSAAAPPSPWMSCWSRVRPAWLLAFRATAAAALAAVLAWDLRAYDPSIMMYYTEWTLLLEIAYFVVAALCSAYGCLKMYAGSRADDDDPESNTISSRLLCRRRSGGDAPVINPISGDAWAGADDGGRLGLVMRVGYQVTAGAVVLTDVVFWGVIVPFMSSSAAHFSLNAVMCCIHSLNLVFLLTETTLNTLAFPWIGMAYFVLWTCLYVIVQWIAHVCGLAWWPYPFLSLTASMAPLWYLAMALLHLPCYLVYWLIVRAKNYVVARSTGKLQTCSDSSRSTV
ncbi:hypothetical protein BAE44_0003441 [Dichanthelium oligosanthes]|uniref:Protein rolling stone n=1 Tax=Dichanthelium oligosanthes TaxID=888268 RepID=A0A1E5WEB0_9POAL|nr:hypothetical protein BAE44_0003441 [Dichanthelium oligosanthes]